MVEKLLRKVKIEVVEKYEDATKAPVNLVPNGGDHKMEAWRLNVTYKGKTQEDVIYMARIGDYENPEPIWVINSMFGASFMYGTYKDDFFKFLAHMSHAYPNDPKRIKVLYDQLKAGHELIKDMFGDDFDLYYRTFLPLKELPQAVMETMAVDEILGYLLEQRNAAGGKYGTNR